MFNLGQKDNKVETDNNVDKTTNPELCEALPDGLTTDVSFAELREELNINGNIPINQYRRRSAGSKVIQKFNQVNRITLQICMYVTCVYDYVR